MIGWAKALLRAWTRWAFLVNGFNPARIDDPEEVRKFSTRLKEQSKGVLYATGVVFVLISPVVVLIAPQQWTWSQMLGALGAGFVTLLVGIGALVWAWRI